MGWLSGIFVYFLIWWIVLFAVLPWGVRVPDEPEPGHASGAPSNPRLWLKVLVTSIVSLAIWLVVFFVMEFGMDLPEAGVTAPPVAPSYCDLAPGHPWHGPYHDEEYGFPVADDDLLFERLVLEINQAGLSWLTVLKKRAAFRAAFHGFAVDRVAAFDDDDRARLLADAGIIRNRRKIDAAIENARRIQGLRGEHRSFAGWLEHHHPRPKAEWVKLFRKTFVFTGGEIVGEFLMSTGYLPGTHRPSCPVYRRIAALNPPWMRAAARSVSGTELPDRR